MSPRLSFLPSSGNTMDVDLPDLRWRKADDEGREEIRLTQTGNFRYIKTCRVYSTSPLDTNQVRQAVRCMPTPRAGASGKNLTVDCKATRSPLTR